METDPHNEKLKLISGWGIIGEILWGRAKAAFVVIPLALGVAILAWFFVSVVFGAELSFVSWLRYGYLGLFGLSTVIDLLSIVRLVFAAIRRRIPIRLMWEAKVRRKLSESNGGYDRSWTGTDIERWVRTRRNMELLSRAIFTHGSL